MKEKWRLDVLLCKRNLVESRQKAQTLIMSGSVFVNGRREEKAGAQFTEEADIEVRDKSTAYVSRGGFKLEKALDTFGISPENWTVLDAGASTGGFTDCLLRRGARKVYAVDVGYGQLDWRLRNDHRVVCMERTNIRYLTKEQIPELLDLVTLDLSFISLGLVLPVIRGFLQDMGQVCCLIKPQFEAGREQVGKKGVVRDKKVHVQVLERFLSMAKNCGFSVKGITFSPIKGPEGNIEFLGHLVAENETPFQQETVPFNKEKTLITKETVDCSKADAPFADEIIDLVERAHEALRRG